MSPDLAVLQPKRSLVTQQAELNSQLVTHGIQQQPSSVTAVVNRGTWAAQRFGWFCGPLYSQQMCSGVLAACFVGPILFAASMVLIYWLFLKVYSSCYSTAVGAMPAPGNAPPAAICAASAMK